MDDWAEGMKYLGWLAVVGLVAIGLVIVGALVLVVRLAF